MKNVYVIAVIILLVAFSFCSAVIADNTQKEVTESITPQIILEEGHHASEYQNEVREKPEFYPWYAQGGTGDPKVRAVAGDRPVYSHDRRERNGFNSRLMIMWRLVDYLSLDEDTATLFFPLYREYMKTHESILKNQRALTKKISKDVENESVSVKDLKKDIEKLFKNEKALSDARDNFHKKSKKILSDRQYVKLIIFKDKLKEDLFSRFRKSRSIEKPVRGEIQTDVEKKK